MKTQKKVLEIIGVCILIIIAAVCLFISVKNYSTPEAESTPVSTSSSGFSAADRATKINILSTTATPVPSTSSAHDVKVKQDLLRATK